MIIGEDKTRREDNCQHNSMPVPLCKLQELYVSNMIIGEDKTRREDNCYPAVQHLSIRQEYSVSCISWDVYHHPPQ